jgi:centromere protein J
MKFPQEYHNKSPSNLKVIEQVIGHDGKIQRLYENGKKEVIFNNGVKREVFPDGYTIVYFNNNDIKQTYPD